MSRPTIVATETVINELAELMKDDEYAQRVFEKRNPEMFTWVIVSELDIMFRAERFSEFDAEQNFFNL